MTETITLELPPLYTKQHCAIYNRARFTFIEASTKAGKTHGCLIWQIHQCFDRIGIHWWVAPSGEQANMAYERAKGYLDGSLYRANDTRRELRLANGSVWRFRTGELPNLLYGEDLQSAVIDEASRMREAAFIAIRSTLTATRGPCRIIGNVAGKKNWFWRLSRKAARGERADMSYHKLTAFDAVEGGVFPLEELEAARDILPDHTFRELYLAEATEDGTNPFGLRKIADCVIGYLSTRPVVAWGWDLAKTTDWTVGVGLDKYGCMADFIRFQNGWDMTTDRIARAVGKTFAVVDSTGNGDPIVERLQKRCENLNGFTFTSRSKPQLIEGLATTIAMREVRFPEGILKDELDIMETTMVRSQGRTTPRYNAPDGSHDDCVIALGLADIALKNRPPEFIFEAGPRF